MRILTCILTFGIAIQAEAMKPRVPKTKPDLAAYMVLQLSSRTNGASPNFTGPTGRNNRFEELPFVSPNFWLLGVTNIFAMSQGRIEEQGIVSRANYITPVSPRICVGAAHTGGGLGSKNLWLLPDGSYYTNEIIDFIRPVKSADIMLMFMAKTNWTYVKIFPNATNKFAYWNHPSPTNVVPVFVRFHQGINRANRFHSTFVSGSRMLGTFSHLNGQFEYGDYSTGDKWVGGDSGGAAYAIIHNEAYLVGCAFTATYATPIAKFTDLINTNMAKLCERHHVPPESLTFCDLRGFKDY